MKKMLKCFITTLFAAALFTACTNSVDNSGSPEKKPKPKETPKERLDSPSISLSYMWNCDKEEIHANGLLDRESLALDNNIAVPWECDFFTWKRLGIGTKVEFITNDSDAELYYTLDGSEPTTKGKKYTGPFELPTISKLRIKAFNSKKNAESDIFSMDIAVPFGTEKIESPIIEEGIGNGLSGAFIIFEALEDLSGPDFTKQHYILKIDDGNRNNGDGISSIGALSFDTRLDANFYYELGDSVTFKNDYYESNGHWSGILWTKDIYQVPELTQDYYTPRPGKWYDTAYKAGYVYDAVSGEHINDGKAEVNYYLYKSTTGYEYAYPDGGSLPVECISEDTSSAKPVAKFFIKAIDGYYYDDVEKKFNHLPRYIYGFPQYNKENYLFQWYTDDYNKMPW